MAPTRSCKICEKTVGKSTFRIQCCGPCKDWMHLSCSGLKKEDLDAVKAEKIKFFCKGCKSEVNRRLSMRVSQGKLYKQSQDSVTSSSESSTDESQGRLATQPGGTKRKSIRDSKNVTIRKKTSTSTDVNIPDLSQKFEKLEESMGFSNGILEELRKSFKNIISENKKIKNEQELLRKKVNHLQNEVEKIKGSLKTSHPQITENTKRNLIIMGLGLQCEGTQESVNVEKLLRLLNIEVQASEYTVKTLPSRIPHKPILLTLPSEYKKQDILLARRAKGKITSADIGLPGEEHNIYLNEDLPEEIRALHNSARELKKHGFKHVWLKNGLVFCRKSDTAKIVKLSTIEQIDDIKANLTMPKDNLDGDSGQD
ncbi:unnamed protein product [Ceutorhynchus assimilis]|uniref:PHD-type domain-containing protein n=1 Tax=Ceutorhynchus assimilis TaxID=467358 RepID=A0A9N9MZL2_9CUCU|nr:unnamed protein product [Ceutorhynchus assimilis]